MLTTKQELITVAETTVSIVDALRGQQDQLKRLIAQKMWISDAPKATLSEIRAQMTELKRLLDQLDADIQEQLKEGQ
jgi:ABC-type transporter Mla subunit MlaD